MINSKRNFSIYFYLSSLHFPAIYSESAIYSLQYILYPPNSPCNIYSVSAVQPLQYILYPLYSPCNLFCIRHIAPAICYVTAIDPAIQYSCYSPHKISYLLYKLLQYILLPLIQPLQYILLLQPLEYILPDIAKIKYFVPTIHSM